MGLPGLILCFIGSFALALGGFVLAGRLFGSPGAPFIAYAGVTLVVITLLANKLADCPRCGTSAFWHSGTRWSNGWPSKHCSKCDLDLRKFHPFDSRAKRGT